MTLGVVSDQIKAKLNDERVAGSTFGALHLALLTTGAPTPTHATVYSDLSPFIPTFTGYANQVVSGWSASVLTADFHALALAAQVTFNNTSGSTSPTIVGWMLYTTSGGNKLVAAGLYGTPFQILDGANYQTVPSWQETSE
jgi:hypothetical protein